MDAATVANQFIDFYYNTFDTNRANLKGLYRPVSSLTFERDTFQGIEDIDDKLTSLPFERIKHVISTKDFQAGPGGCLLVFVTGQLQTDNDQPQMFSQAFTLVPEAGSFYVHNDIFRLSFAA